jgi:hypothetical protein
VSEAPTARLERFAAVQGSLAALSDRRLTDLLAGGAVLGAGIGGPTRRLHVDGTPVFVKSVPLTDRERRPGNVRSTANLFDLPVWCQYGVGSPSFGVWRELAAHTMATEWVLNGQSASFPLLYHWRVLDQPGHPALHEELADVDGVVEYWHGSTAVRERVEAMASASATVTLFIEYVLATLREWLGARAATGDDGAVDEAVAMVERALRTDVAFMNDAGLFHFDAHFNNILTDGERLYFADFGLATSPKFDLSAAESSFLAANRTHDACHAITGLVNWVVTRLVGVPDWQERNAFVRGCAEGHVPVGLVPAAAAVLARHAPVAAVINEFCRRLHVEDRRTRYPAEAVERAGARGLSR